MEQQKLRELLETLHRELEHVETVDETTGRVICTLKEDLSRFSDEPCAVDLEGDEPLMERMQEAAGHFETDHPKLAMALQHVLDSLARMGL